ncbi:efflux RND transporter periplasmic adaptor subunit [Chlorobium phaeovibrioides]|uniref:HlyD family efflux transporter periplasmic adaptor subunit n=1 Tax=Chlorobium phaeovibrioides TaxID=1094 RepID=A0A432AV09_CHLPH|nr:HlyD family efflux transporter periplasmic adaptor subunit [Chlorobium phaeovibrioides]QEQ57287.1 HlyD family efflux transporter periplasmic adaptor subunit [Chlorobium phaeovibrioides]RTY38417.1 HlyD family efflux transporter periplasmic adaptor subunit [Chlorobium phaeovibrioides]
MASGNKVVWGLSAAAVAAVVILLFVFAGRKTAGQQYTVINPSRGTLVETVSTTGVVEPRNRLKIQPAIAGRVEEVMVQEGEMVEKGRVLALLSSSERAALLDAAKLQGKDEQAYWKSVYRETAVLAPIDGQVIVRSIEPGQTVSASDSLFVLSDRLTVTAFVDETDIGRVQNGQRAVISLDAYPDIRVGGEVSHIYYESHLQNNVSIYFVDVVPDSIPSVYRSGMSANIDIAVRERQHALLLPRAAVRVSGKRSEVLLEESGGGGSGGRNVAVITGISDDDSIEILGGISDSARVLMPDASFVLPSEKDATNPFMPRRKKKKDS